VLGAIHLFENGRQVFMPHEARLPCLDVGDLLIELSALLWGERLTHRRAGERGE
jgi:hypothetical protein